MAKLVVKNGVLRLDCEGDQNCFDRSCKVQQHAHGSHCHWICMSSDVQRCTDKYPVARHYRLYHRRCPWYIFYKYGTDIHPLSDSVPSFLKTWTFSSSRVYLGDTK